MVDPIEPSSVVELDYASQLSKAETEARTKLTQTWEEDAKWKLERRKFFGWVFPTALLVQNVIVYGFIWYAAFKGVPVHGSEPLAIKDIQALLSVLVAGTVGQTVGIIHIMVKWIFSDIKYSDHPMINGKT